MDSPSSPDTSTRRATTSSANKSVRACGLTRTRIDKQELRAKLIMPEYIRTAVWNSIQSKDSDGVAKNLTIDKNAKPPVAPMVVFINSRSGGRHGPELMLRLHHLICEEQVFDLQKFKPDDFIEHGLGCLDKLAGWGDQCAEEIRKKIRIMVAGGDGTVGWILGCLGKLHEHGREPVPPVGIIPLGTGNDLSRTFGWGGSFPFAWKSAVKSTLDKAATGKVCRLDSWHVVVSMPSCGNITQIHSLKPTQEGLEIEGQLPEKTKCFGGVFYNYFSIGMDAQIAYGFHHLRNEKPKIANGPIANKLIYSGYTCSQGWFCTPCISHPNLSGLNNMLSIKVKKSNSPEWEEIHVPDSVRAIVALNLDNYACGRHPWGNLTPEYLAKRGFVEAHAADGLLEIFGLKHGWHASFVMSELISAKHIAQAAAIRLEIRGGERTEAYMQMDGEPWMQSLSKDIPTYVEIKSVPFQSLIIRGK